MQVKITNLFVKVKVFPWKEFIFSLKCLQFCNFFTLSFFRILCCYSLKWWTDQKNIRLFARWIVTCAWHLAMTLKHYRDIYTMFIFGPFTELLCTRENANYVTPVNKARTTSNLLKKLIFETLLECTFDSTKKHCTCIDVVLAILFCYQNSTFWLFRITNEVDCSEVWSERVNCAFDIFIQRLKIKLRYHWWHEIFNEVKLHSNTTVFVYDEGPSTSKRKRPSTNQWGHTGPGYWWKNWLQERYQYFLSDRKIFFLFHLFKSKERSKCKTKSQFCL